MFTDIFKIEYVYKVCEIVTGELQLVHDDFGFYGIYGCVSDLYGCNVDVSSGCFSIKVKWRIIISTEHIVPCIFIKLTFI